MVLDLCFQKDFSKFFEKAEISVCFCESLKGDFDFQIQKEKYVFYSHFSFENKAIPSFMVRRRKT